MQSRASRSGLERQLGRILGAGLGEPAALAASCAEVRDWRALFDCAREHELLGALYDLVRRNDVDLEPALGVAIGHETFVTAASQQPLRSQLFEVLDALEGAGVRAVALKGPLLAERIYPSATLRQSADLDVLVGRDDVDRAVDVLGRLGYFLAETEAGQRYVRRTSYQLILLHPERERMLELHFLALRAFGSALDAESLLGRAIPYESPDGRAALVLAPDDELLYLAVHAAKHFQLRLKWYYDIALFTRRHADLNADRIAVRAREAGVERGLSHALDLVQQYFGATTLRDGRSAPRRRGYGVATARSLGARLGHSGRISTLLSIAYSALLADTVPGSMSVLRLGLARLVRRRAHRYAPWLVPDDWSA